MQNDPTVGSMPSVSLDYIYRLYTLLLFLNCSKMGTFRLKKNVYFCPKTTFSLRHNHSRFYLNTFFYFFIHSQQILRIESGDPKITRRRIRDPLTILTDNNLWLSEEILSFLWHPFLSKECQSTRVDLFLQYKADNQSCHVSDFFMNLKNFRSSKLQFSFFEPHSFFRWKMCILTTGI